MCVSLPPQVVQLFHIFHMFCILTDYMPALPLLLQIQRYRLFPMAVTIKVDLKTSSGGKYVTRVDKPEATQVMFTYNNSNSNKTSTFQHNVTMSCIIDVSTLNFHDQHIKGVCMSQLVQLISSCPYSESKRWQRPQHAYSPHFQSLHESN